MKKKKKQSLSHIFIFPFFNYILHQTFLLFAQTETISRDKYSIESNLFIFILFNDRAIKSFLSTVRKKEREKKFQINIPKIFVEYFNSVPHVTEKYVTLCFYRRTTINS